MTFCSTYATPRWLSSHEVPFLDLEYMYKGINAPDVFSIGLEERAERRGNLRAVRGGSVKLVFVITQQHRSNRRPAPPLAQLAKCEARELYANVLLFADMN